MMAEDRGASTPPIKLTIKEKDREWIFELALGKERQARVALRENRSGSGLENCWIVPVDGGLAELADHRRDSGVDQRLLSAAVWTADSARHWNGTLLCFAAGRQRGWSVSRIPGRGRFGT